MDADVHGAGVAGTDFDETCGVIRSPTAIRPFSGRIRLGVPELLEMALELVPLAVPRARSLPWSARSWALLDSADGYEVFVNTWPSGGSIELHDHGDSAGAAVVVAGELTETRVVTAGSGIVSGTRVETFLAGHTLSLELGCIHDLVNRGPMRAVSVHAYSPRLRSMTFYDNLGSKLGTVGTLRYDS